MWGGPDKGDCGGARALTGGVRRDTLAAGGEAGMGRKAIPVGRFVETLCSFQNEPITRDRILNYLRETAVDRSTLDPFVHFLPDAYTRNLIHRDELMEEMAVCWQPGQRPGIPTHNAQPGARTRERGAPTGIRS